MADIDLKLTKLERLFPGLSESDLAKAKTLLLKELSFRMHRFYGGKMQTVPKAGLYGFNWFNVWYTPGVSKISTSIRDDHDASFQLSNRGNLVAVVSDSTRVLGDGNVSPSGGLGVMEGKAFLMKYLGGIDAVALCIDSRDAQGVHQPARIIEFVKMLEPSVGAVNLEDIAQPGCFEVLDRLREHCNIPVWHDDAQGTASVILGGLFNALKVTKRKIGDARIVLYGAGASNTCAASLILQAGGDPAKMILCDTKGPLHKGRKDVEADRAFYRKWDLCLRTNPACVDSVEAAFDGADVLIAASKPGPDTIKPEWVRRMAKKSICFVCANPVPEIWPHECKAAGAAVVATGRGDFPNQVNNSLGFPGILKGALIVRAKTVTDGMAIAASRAMADYVVKRGRLCAECIMPTMDDADFFPIEAATVAMQAIKEGVARVKMSFEEVRAIAATEIKAARKLTHELMDRGHIKEPPQKLLQEAVDVVRRTMGVATAPKAKARPAAKPKPKAAAKARPKTKK